MTGPKNANLYVAALVLLALALLVCVIFIHDWKLLLLILLGSFLMERLMKLALKRPAARAAGYDADIAPLLDLAEMIVAQIDVHGSMSEMNQDLLYAEIAGLRARLGDLRGAVSTARRTNTLAQLAFPCAFAAVARQQVRAGDLRGATKTAKRIPSIAKGRSKVFAEIAGEQAAMGDFAGATATVKSIRDVDSRDFALSRIVAARAKAGDFSEAQSLAAQIADPCWNIDAWTAIVIALAESDDIEGAEEAAGLAKRGLRGSGYAAISAGKAKRNDVDGARQTADGIEDGSDRRHAYEAIAVARVGVGDYEGAKHIASNTDSPAATAAVWRAIATQQAEQGDVEAAMETAGSIWDTQSEEGPWQFAAGEQAMAYAASAVAQARCGNLAAAKEVADRVTTEYADVTDISRARAWMGREMARAAAKAGVFSLETLPETLQDATERAVTMLGAAEGILDRAVSEQTVSAEGEVQSGGNG